MPFVPAFSEAGESQFIDKLMVVVHRDMKLALDYFYPPVSPDTGLPDFAAMVRGAPGVFVYPLLSLAMERGSSTDAESGEWLNQELVCGAALAVKDSSVAAVQAKAEKYVRVFKAVLRKGILECLPSVSSLVDYTLDIDHRYLRHGEKAPDFFQPVEFEIKVRFGEK